MGFGHAVYTTEDPRVRMLRETARELGDDLVDFACAVEERVVAILAEVKPDRRRYVLEQSAERRIVRPATRYVGPPAPQHVPVSG
jgi:citrate synthase